MSRPLPPPDDLAVFLDLDGTLLEIVARPHLVNTPAWLGDLLTATAIRLHGALALISGRPIAELDRFLGSPALPAAGLHGLERRGCDGVIRRASAATIPDSVRRELEKFSQSTPGVLIEDKTRSIAVHFRQAPDKAEAVHNKLTSIGDSLGEAFALQAGKMVFELRPRGTDKGTALTQFMGEQPFKGRVPVFIGDDVTDEDGFVVANAFDGYSVRVGAATEETCARYSLPNVDAVHDWLERLDCGLF